MNFHKKIITNNKLLLITNIFTESSKKKISLTRKEIVDIIRYKLFEDNDVLFSLIEEHLFNINKQTCSLSVEVKKELRKVISKFRSKFVECHRTYDRFINTNESWLGVEMNLLDNPNDPDLSEEPSTSRGNTGRPSSAFSDCSERTKRRRTQSLREQNSVEELAYATQMSFRAAGKLDAAQVVMDVSEGSPTKATRYRTSLNHQRENPMTKEEALSLIIENKLSKNHYNNIRAASIRHNCKLFPSYGSALQAKKECYPCSSDITITECSAEVKLQALLDHTVLRILLSQNDVIKTLSADDVRNVNLICKWGCDGTSGQSNFKQKFTDDNDGEKTDATIFFTSIVPLQIISSDNESQKQIIIWKNPRPSSPRFCRPIKIEFLKETAESTRCEVDKIKEQERNLQPLQLIIDGKEINVNYQLALTMIDGKLCNSLTETSTQRCYLCHCTSKQFNDIDEMLKKEIKESNLQFGISSLHAWIRLFECLLHVSYKLDVKKWQNRGVDKESVEIRKKNIQKGFRQQLGLLIYHPKQGYGSTNDGNTARKFFENSRISASITGIDENLINRFHIILQVISCGFEINVQKYEEYCVETARLFVHLYPWYYMPTTVHKLLIHSTKIIQSSLLPIGQMSEEAQESCNKFIKQYRQDFARKCSRAKNIFLGVFLRLLASSDPLISSLRKLPRKQMKSLHSEAIKLLKPPNVADSNLYTSSPLSSSDESEHTSDEEY